MQSHPQVGVKAVAFCLGEEIVSNEELQREQPGWDMAKAVERAGVYSRPIARAGTTALDLGYSAAQAVLSKVGIGAKDVDALIFCTQTPDYVMPPNSSLLHGRLAMRNDVMALDLSHACSGFMYSLGVARSLVSSGVARQVLLVTADTYSRLVHPDDRSTRLLFGDAAAATIVSSDSLKFEILDMSFGTSGMHAESFIVRQGGFREREREQVAAGVVDRAGRVHSPSHIHMDGLRILSYFNGVIPTEIESLLAKNGLNIGDVSTFIFHQASRLALDGISKALKIPPEKLFGDMRHTGNLVSSSIPVVLADLFDKRASPSMGLGVLCGFGVGLSWSTALVRF